MGQSCIFSDLSTSFQWICDCWWRYNSNALLALQNEKNSQMVDDITVNEWLHLLEVSRVCCGNIPFVFESTHKCGWRCKRKQEQGNKHDPKDQEDQIPPLHIGKFPANLIWSGRGRRDGWQIAVLANYCACVLGMAVPTKDIPYLGGYI